MALDQVPHLLITNFHIPTATVSGRYSFGSDMQGSIDATNRSRIYDVIHDLSVTAKLRTEIPFYIVIQARPDET